MQHLDLIQANRISAWRKHHPGVKHRPSGSSCADGVEDLICLKVVLCHRTVCGESGVFWDICGVGAAFRKGAQGVCKSRDLGDYRGVYCEFFVDGVVVFAV